MKRLLVATLAIIVLAACGSGAESQQNASGATTLDFMWGTDGSSVYDPHIAGNPFVYPFLYPAYDRLFQLDEQGQVQPMLAESHAFSDDGLTLTLTLRDGVTFHDGEPFDAQAVKANIERAKSLERSTVVEDLAAVESVEAVDQRTVVLHLSRPSAALPALLADRAGMMVSPAAFDNENLELHPVGAGPFKVMSHQPGSAITYQAYDGYWDPSVQTIDELTIHMEVNPQTRLNAVRSGQVDATVLNADQLDAAKRADIQVDVASTVSVFMMYLNKSSEALGNPTVRKALQYAINRDVIGKTYFFGTCEPAVQVLPTTSWAHNKEIQPAQAYRYDPQRARELLAQAGYPNGFSMKTVVINVPFYVGFAEILQAQLRKVGVELEVEPLEPSRLISTYVVEKASDGYTSMWPGSADPAKTVASLLLKDSFMNPGGYAVPELATAAQQALTSLERPQRQAAYAEVMRLQVENALHLPVCSPGRIMATQQHVEGLEPNHAGNFDFRSVQIAK